MKPPSYETYLKYLKRVPASTRVLGRMGPGVASATFYRGSGGAAPRFPMQRIEIDEWWAHVHLIDGNVVPFEKVKNYPRDLYKPVRLWVALVLESASRFPLGVSLSYTPCSENVLSALRMALGDRTALSRALGGSTAWGPRAGLAGVYTDGGTSFDERFAAGVHGMGGVFAQGPSGRAEMRATVEAAFRNLSNDFMPHFTGQTFSNPMARGNYKAEDRASTQVADFAWQLPLHLFEVYANKSHHGRFMHGQTPRNAWLEGVRDYDLPPPVSDHTLRVYTCLKFDATPSKVGSRSSIRSTTARHCATMLRSRASRRWRSPSTRSTSARSRSASAKVG